MPLTLEKTVSGTYGDRNEAFTFTITLKNAKYETEPIHTIPVSYTHLKIVVIGTYIKRRSNLLFVAGQEGSIRSEELLLCVNESAESLRLYGVNCGVKISGCQRLAPEIAYMVYDILEAVIVVSYTHLFLS